MSKSVAAPRASEKMSAASKDRPGEAKPAPKAFAPLKPRRKLAIALLVIFIVWIVLLYVMYFTTVYGHAAQ